MPAVLNRKASDWRTASSSSTMCTTKLPGIAAYPLARRLEREMEERPAARIWLGPHLPAMRFDDALGDGQADTHTSGLCCDEGLKQARRNLPGKAASRVGNPHLDHALFQQGGLDDELLARATVHRLDCVADQVQQHLLDLHLLHEDRASAGIEAEDRLNTLLLRAYKSQGTCLFDQLVDVLRPLLRLATCHECAQLTDDLSRSQRLVGSLGQGIVNLRGVRMLDALDQSIAPLQVVGDGRERLIDLMRKRRGHLTHCREARESRQ